MELDSPGIICCHVAEWPAGGDDNPFTGRGEETAALF